MTNQLPSIAIPGFPRHINLEVPAGHIITVRDYLGINTALPANLITHGINWLISYVYLAIFYRTILL